MDESSRQALLSRRNLLTAGAISTGAVWVVPIVTGVNMASAHAASGAAERARPGAPRGPGNDSSRGGDYKPTKPTSKPTKTTTESSKPTTKLTKPTTEPAPPVTKDRSVPGAPRGRGNNSSLGGGNRWTTESAPLVTKDHSGGLAKTGW